MSKIIAVFTSAMIVVFTLLGLVYTKDLTQKNKETIFLTKAGQDQYKDFQEEFSEKNIIIVKKIIDAKTKQDFPKEIQKLKDKCLHLCEVIAPNDLPENMLNLFKLRGEDHLSFVIISELNESFIKDYLLDLTSNPFWGKIGVDLHLIGAPYTNILLDRYSKNIQEKLFPLLFIGIFLAILIITRNLKTSITLFIPCVSSAVVSLVTIKTFYQNTNLIFAVIPLILFVITLSLVMHIYYTAIEEKDLSNAITKKKKPIFLMISSTYIGFLSLYLSEIEVIRQFGILSSSLILLSSLITIIWLIQINRVLKYIPKLTEKIDRKGFPFVRQIFNSTFTKLQIALICLTSIVLGGLIFPTIPINTDATSYFPKSSGLKESIDLVANTVAGPPIIEIILDEEEMIEIEGLKKIALLEEKIRKSISNRKIPLNMLSLNTLVRKANQNYTNEDKIPDLQVSYAALASKIPLSIGEGYPAFEENYRITITGGAINVDSYEQILNDIENILNKDNRKYSLNGLYYHLMMAQKKMIDTFLKSFLFSLILISLIAFFTFKQVKVFFIFLIVNIIPVLINFIAMKVLGLSFNIATVMTYSISLGLIVDSTFHIIHALDSNCSKDYFYKTVTTPVLQASLLLSFAFGIFYFNDFLPIKEFGVCLSMIIATGMIFDLKILPTLYTGKSH